MSIQLFVIDGNVRLNRSRHLDANKTAATARIGKQIFLIAGTDKRSITVEQLVTAGITTVAALISWWNNNSFTSAAIQADAEYARLKQKSE